MAHNHVWNTAAIDGHPARYLCVGCLELRLVRDLQPDDFTDVPCNTHLSGLETPRLLARLLPQARFVITPG